MSLLAAGIAALEQLLATDPTMLLRVVEATQRGAVALQ